MCLKTHVGAQLSSHNWRPSGDGSKISCSAGKVISCLVFLASTSGGTGWESLPIQCLQLQRVVWKCLPNEVWPQPHSIKLTREFELPGILNQHHHTWPQDPLLVMFVEGDFPSPLNGFNVLSSHSSPLIELLQGRQSIPQRLAIRES